MPASAAVTGHRPQVISHKPQKGWRMAAEGLQTVPVYGVRQTTDGIRNRKIRTMNCEL